MPVLQTPTAARWPVGESTRSSASEEALLSEPDQNIQRLRAFTSATHPLTETQVRSISSSLTIVPHRWAEWRHCKKCRLAGNDEGVT